MSSRFIVKPAHKGQHTEGLFYISEDKGSYGYLCKDGVIRSAAYQNGHTREQLITKLDSSYCESESQALDIIARVEKTGKYKPKPVKSPPEFLYCRFKMRSNLCNYIVMYRPLPPGGENTRIIAYKYSYYINKKEGYSSWISTGSFNFSNMHEFQSLRLSDIPKHLKGK